MPEMDQTLAEHAVRIRELEDARLEHTLTLKAIQDNTTETKEAVTQILSLSAEQIKHSEALERAFGEIEEIDHRVSSIEQAMPVLKLFSGWVSTVVTGVIMLLIGGGLSLLIRA